MPRLCNISVWGFEREVLKGLSQQIPYISFSTVCTPWWIDKAIECIRLARELGGEKFCLSTNKASTTDFLKETWCDSETMIAILNNRLKNMKYGVVFVYVKNKKAT